MDKQTGGKCRRHLTNRLKPKIKIMKTLTKLALAIKEARYMNKVKLALTESRSKSALSDTCRLILFAFGIASLVIVNAANATCPDGAERPCTINGKHGRQTCAHFGWGPCVPDEGPPATSGTVHPKYYVLEVIYAPPGTQGGRSSSSVTYGSRSTAGTTVSSSYSFKESTSTTISAGGGVLGTGTEIGVSFGYGQSDSESHSLDIKKSASTEISDSGPSSDGINHDHDLIYLWLNPTVELQLTPTSAAWNLGDNPQADIQYVYVGQLKDPSKNPIPQGVLDAFQRYGITPQDYPEMLKADPFAGGTSRIDPERFHALNTTFPYEPPFAQGDPVPTYKFVAGYSSTGTRNSTVQNEYTTGISISGSGDFLTLFKASVKRQNSWTWTDTDTNSTSSATSESVSVTVGGPAYGYSGPTDIGVYYDVLYKTYLFAPVDTTLQPLSLHGSVRSSSGKAVGEEEVVLVANGVKYRTFTNTKGEYRIFGTISGPLQLQVDGTKKQLPQVPPDKKADIVLSIAKEESGSKR